MAKEIRRLDRRIDDLKSRIATASLSCSLTAPKPFSSNVRLSAAINFVSDKDFIVNRRIFNLVPDRQACICRPWRAVHVVRGIGTRLFLDSETSILGNAARRGITSTIAVSPLASLSLRIFRASLFSTKDALSDQLSRWQAPLATTY